VHCFRNVFNRTVWYPVVLSILTSSTFTPSNTIFTNEQYPVAHLHRQTQSLLTNSTCYIDYSDICFDFICHYVYIVLDQPDDDQVEMCVCTLNLIYSYVP